MAPQTESTRIVIVRPTRDGDHIIINVTFGKLNKAFSFEVFETGIEILQLCIICIQSFQIFGRIDTYSRRE